MLAFAVGAAFDWFWEIADMGAIFFLAAGVLVSCALRAARFRPAAHSRPRVAATASPWPGSPWPGSRPSPWSGRCWSNASSSRARPTPPSGNLGSALDHAGTARSIEPWAASPYVQLGLLAELQGDYPSAIAHFSDAIERENHNWQWCYLRSEAEHENGEEGPALKRSEEGRELNPLGRLPARRRMGLQVSGGHAQKVTPPEAPRTEPPRERPAERKGQLSGRLGRTGPDGVRGARRPAAPAARDRRLAGADRGALHRDRRDLTTEIGTLF